MSKTPNLKEHAQNQMATRSSMMLDRLQTFEPHDTKKDEKLSQYALERCMYKDQDGELRVLYQDILDAIRFGTSHLMSVSHLDDDNTAYQFSQWRLTKHILEIRYDALGDQEALGLIRALDETKYNILWGRANQGTHQKYDAMVAGSRRSVTVEETQRKGIRGRLGL